jgi:poly(A) polymerase
MNPMEEHPQARQIVDTLTKAGFVAYYAGGWVRDFLLNHPSDDIDIATNAPPEMVQKLFSHTVPIGISFGIILVIIDGHEYEVATFREDLDYQDGRRPKGVSFSSAKEDAKRRDFTINGMFFDPLSNTVLDYVEGRKDLDAKIIRAIGNPHERIREDRLRMIRAIRLSCRFHFEIEKETKEAILSHVEELFPSVAIERIWQELKKAHDFSKLSETLIKLHEFHLLSVIFPDLRKTSILEVKERMKIASSYPKDTPVIAFVLALFPNYSLENALSLCQKLKLSKREQDFVSTLFHIRKELEKEEKKPKSLDLYDWSLLYSNRFISEILSILQCHLNPEIQKTFLLHHEERMRKLSSFIQRIHENNPVVKAKDLMQEGISPGEKMGKLLKEANRLCVNLGIEDPKIAIEELKKHPAWK